MCFNGQLRFVCVSKSLGDTSGGCVSFFGPDGNRAPFKRKDYPEYRGDDVLPPSYAKMRLIAERMSRLVGAPFLRVDFYDVGGRPYFSEFTFYPCGGTVFFDPPEYDAHLGGMLDIADVGRERGPRDTV
jgi:hypothetical protein